MLDLWFNRMRSREHAPEMRTSLRLEDMTRVTGRCAIKQWVLNMQYNGTNQSATYALLLATPC